MKYAIVKLPDVNFSKLYFKKAECVLDKCKNHRFGTLAECALHCSSEKIDVEAIDRYNDTFYELFFEYLGMKINDRLVKSDYLEWSEEDDKDYYYYVAHLDDREFPASLSKSIDEQRIIVENINFPEDSIPNRLQKSLIRLIKTMGITRFENCTFNSNITEHWKDPRYYDCVFTKKTFLGHVPIRSYDNEYRFNKCNFLEDINIRKINNKKPEFFNVFNECRFKKSLEISDSIINGNLFKSLEIKKRNNRDSINESKLLK